MAFATVEEKRRLEKGNNHGRETICNYKLNCTPNDNYVLLLKWREETRETTVNATTDKISSAGL